MADTQLEEKKTTQVAKKEEFDVFLMEQLDKATDALPIDFNKQRFVQNTISLLTDHPELAKAGRGQLKIGLLKGATLGLDFFNKECYLVPYGSQLQFQIDYKGSKKLAKKYATRPIKDIGAEIVRQGDDFQKVIEGNNTTFIFKPMPFNGNDVIGAFAYVYFEDGGCQVEEMNKVELDKVRNCSKAKNSLAWSTFTTEMYKKTVLHRLCKHIDIDINAEQRRIVDDDMAIDTSTQNVVCDNPFVEVE